VQNNQNPEYLQHFHVRSYEVDLRHSITPASILNYMQETASAHAGLLGYGYADIMREKKAWVLLRSYTEISGTAGIGEEIAVETRIASIEKITGTRDFLISAKDGSEIARSRSIWILMDLESRKPVRLNTINSSVSGREPLINFSPEKIQPDLPMQQIYERNIGYSCIDINQHVNNVKYIEFAMDALPEQFLKEHRLSAVQINFLTETKFGDLLTISASEPGPGKVFVDGRIAGTVAFQSYFQFTQE
jgi:medium-chain acyl-[acyl-carrier-protein] hydrolase